MGGSAWVCPFNDKKDERPRAGSSTREHAAHGGGPPSPRSPLPTLSLSGPKRRSPAAGCNLRFIAVTPLTLLRCPPRSFPPLAPFPPFPPLRPSHPLSSPPTCSHSRPRPPLVYPLRVYCATPYYIARHTVPRSPTTRHGAVLPCQVSLRLEWWCVRTYTVYACSRCSPVPTPPCPDPPT